MEKLIKKMKLLLVDIQKALEEDNTEKLHKTNSCFFGMADAILELTGREFHWGRDDEGICYLVECVNGTCERHKEEEKDV